MPTIMPVLDVPPLIMLFIESESIIPCMGIIPPRLTSVRIVHPTARELRIQSVVRRPFDMFYPLELPHL